MCNQLVNVFTICYVCDLSRGSFPPPTVITISPHTQYTLLYDTMAWLWQTQLAHLFNTYHPYNCHCRREHNIDNNNKTMIVSCFCWFIFTLILFTCTLCPSQCRFQQINPLSPLSSHACPTHVYLFHCAVLQYCTAWQEHKPDTFSPSI